MTKKNEHRLVNDTLVAEAGGIVGRCVCGWSTGPRFTSMVASALFRDHQARPTAPEPPNLYDVAREVCHEHGMAWTDPRTGKRHDPPSAPITEEAMRSVLQRQAAIHTHAQELTCPECTSPQIQIMNLSDQGQSFHWRCRTCHQAFVSGRE